MELTPEVGMFKMELTLEVGMFKMGRPSKDTNKVGRPRKDTNQTNATIGSVGGSMERAGP